MQNIIFFCNASAVFHLVLFVFSKKQNKTIITSLTIIFQVYGPFQLKSPIARPLTRIGLNVIVRSTVVVCICSTFSLLHYSINYGNRKITYFLVCSVLNTSSMYKARDIFKATCSSFCSGINLQRKLSINKISSMSEILACFQLLTLKKNPELKHEDRICHYRLIFVGEQGFPSLKSLQGLHLPLS